jgi:hypothetical protein
VEAGDDRALGSNFNTAVWEAVQSDIGLAEDPTLQVDLATFFEDLDELARLQLHLIDFTAGVGSTLGGGSKLTRDSYSY